MELLSEISIHNPGHNHDYSCEKNENQPDLLFIKIKHVLYVLRGNR